MKISPHLSGDPLVAPATAASISDILALLGPGAPAGARLMPLAPGAALLHRLDDGAGHLTFRWVRLPRPRILAPGAAAVEFALVLTGSIRDGGRAARLAGRLMAALRDTGLQRQGRAAASREDLVRALAPVEETCGECAVPPDDLLALLGSSRSGLPDREAGRRLRTCGSNRIERIRRRSVATLLLEQLSSFFAILLWVGGACALAAGMPQLGWAIFVVILVNAAFSFFQEYRAESEVEALQALLPQEVSVVRDGVERRLAAAMLVPGDVALLAEGDRVPADGQILGADAFQVDQSALTGESQPALKTAPAPERCGALPRLERPDLLFAGSSAVSGSATCVVTATGMGTEIGAIAHLTQSVPEAQSPLQREMVRVTRLVSILALCFGAIFLALGMASDRMELGEGFFFALGVIVANVPEGLLPTLTVSLALGVQRMARRGSLLKRLSAAETLGSTTVICTDKTGTLTENRMMVRFAWVSGRSVEASELSSPAGGEPRDLLEAAVLASQAVAGRGDPTELALLAMAEQAGVDVEASRRRHPVLATHPFDSFRKRMALVRATGAAATVYLKGAPGEVLGLCATARHQGRTEPLTESRRRAILQDHDRMASAGLRLLAMAVRPLAAQEVGAPAAQIERELTFLGLVALWDPPRPEVPAAIESCRRAGIRVVMITGDHGLTAQAIARRIGLEVHKVITGGEMERLTSEALRMLLKEPGVLFARTSPVHKLRIVSELRAAGEVVAATGDGVNDAPALRAADIGVAMGRRGSDVAREAAAMVITDDNFASIVEAVHQGRTIYANIGKFVTYIFASNVPELVPFLAFVFLGIPLPLTVMQILAVDLGTDLLPALALGAEPPEPGLMDRPPRPRQERLLGARRLLRAYGFLGLAEAALAMGAFFWTYWLAGWRPGLPMPDEGDLYRRATTMTLAGIVAAQIGNVFACRTDRESILRVGLFSNPRLLLGVLSEIALLAGLILIPPLADVFGLAAPSFEEWRILLLFPVAMVAVEEGRKWIVRRWRSG